MLKMSDSRLHCVKERIYGERDERHSDCTEMQVKEKVLLVFTTTVTIL